MGAKIDRKKLGNRAAILSSFRDESTGQLSTYNMLEIPVGKAKVKFEAPTAALQSASREAGSWHSNAKSQQLPWALLDRRRRSRRSLRQSHPMQKLRRWPRRERFRQRQFLLR
jgi:hypothetical protein